jgi:hypothetical protein
MEHGNASRVALKVSDWVAATYDNPTAIGINILS